MKKLLIIIIVICFLPQIIAAQLWKERRFEISAGIGTTQFYGDIGGYSTNENLLGLRDFSFKQTRFNINASARYRIAQAVSARVSLAFGIFHSTDSRGSNIQRGFESRTTFFEPSLIGEYYFIRNKDEKSFMFLNVKNTVPNSLFRSLDFYAFAGIGGLSYNVNPNDVLIPYAPKTSGVTGVVPLGIGVTMIYSDNFNLGVEIGGRFTLSDNIDGYTSDKSQFNDIYHLVNFTVTYKINSVTTGCGYDK